MNDRSGESILYAVLAGDRKVKQGARRCRPASGRSGPAQPLEVGRDWRGARCVCVAGPRSVFGVDAFRMMHKGNNGNSPRVLTRHFCWRTTTPKATMQQFSGRTRRSRLFCAGRRGAGVGRLPRQASDRRSSGRIRRRKAGRAAYWPRPPTIRASPTRNGQAKSRITETVPSPGVRPSSARRSNSSAAQRWCLTRQEHTSYMPQKCHKTVTRLLYFPSLRPSIAG